MSHSLGIRGLDMIGFQSLSFSVSQFQSLALSRPTPLHYISISASPCLCACIFYLSLLLINATQLINWCTAHGCECMSTIISKPFVILVWLHWILIHTPIHKHICATYMNPMHNRILSHQMHRFFGRRLIIEYLREITIVCTVHAHAIHICGVWSCYHSKRRVHRMRMPIIMCDIQANYSHQCKNDDRKLIAWTNYPYQKSCKSECAAWLHAYDYSYIVQINDCLCDKTFLGTLTWQRNYLKSHQN